MENIAIIDNNKNKQLLNIYYVYQLSLVGTYLLIDLAVDYVLSVIITFIYV